MLSVRENAIWSTGPSRALSLKGAKLTAYDIKGNPVTISDAAAATEDVLYFTGSSLDVSARPSK